MKKVTPLSQRPPLKIENPTFFENLLGGSIPPTAERGGGTWNGSDH